MASGGEYYFFFFRTANGSIDMVINSKVTIPSRLRVVRDGLPSPITLPLCSLIKTVTCKMIKKNR